MIKPVVPRAEGGDFRAPRNMEIHVGSEDWQSVSDELKDFSNLTGASVHIAPNLGHMLGRAYVGGVLDRWLF